MCLDYLKSSIGKKQIVAATGLLLILFVMGHLAGNLLILVGPKAYNGYAKILISLRPGLYFIEAGLALIFFIHVWTTLLLIHDNLRARPIQYARYEPKGKNTLLARLMPISGTILVAFVIWHLMDFTFTDHEGSRSILADGKNYGLYGLVVNTLSIPVHSLFYILAMMSLGLHLSHGVESFIQTFGWQNTQIAPVLIKISNYFGIFIAFSYSLIPIYILFLTH